MNGREPWNFERATQVVEGHAGRPGALLPALHALQDTFGCVPDAAVPLLAARFNLSRADVHGVVSFYHDFRRHPPGRHVLRLCRAEACQSMGAERVAAALRARLAVEWGATSADGAVTLEPTFCLGLCAVAPAALLDGRPMGRVDEAAILSRLEAQA
jgi:formate dehydrogenase subunit gamma